MLGLMQDWPLLMHRLLDHAARHHPRREIVSRSVEGPIHRTSWSGLRARALRLAQRLARDGIRPGDRIATLAWNTWRHLESWYGIGGSGRSTTPSTRACSRTRSSTSSTMRATA